jgi:hypothetical protein
MINKPKYPAVRKWLKKIWCICVIKLCIVIINYILKVSIASKILLQFSENRQYSRSQICENFREKLRKYTKC